MVSIFYIRDLYEAKFWILQIAAKHAFPVPAAIPEIVAILTSGLTASIGLEQVSRSLDS
jgi:hypothetical protein